MGGWMDGWMDGWMGGRMSVLHPGSTILTVAIRRQ